MSKDFRGAEYISVNISLLSITIETLQFVYWCGEHCIVEPQSGFNIAFNMFDTDGDQRVDKKEFLVVSPTVK